jgi:hypothetical protein
LSHVVKEAATITAFIFVMMLVIEYANILSQGKWQTSLRKYQWGQYLFAAFLGAMPGCLGPFAIVSMYAHRMVSFGAVVATMIATSGDESFVMLAMIPKQALLLTLILFFLGIGAGYFTDVVLKNAAVSPDAICGGYEFHLEEKCECFPPLHIILNQWKSCTLARGVLSLILIVFALSLAFGLIGPTSWNWIRVTLLLLSSIAFFIVISVPDHFLDEHLWGHVVQKHIPRVFLWTFSTLMGLFFLTENFSLEGILRENEWMIMAIASFVGLIPESGPHYVFVTLYAKELIPISVLLASSIVQDGHGMLPVLAYSRKAFFIIKAINLLIGLMVGVAALSMGY